MKKKKCIKCQKEKIINEFTLSTRRTGHRAGQTFYSGSCKECSATYQRQYRKDNPESVKEYNKLWGERNPDYGKKYARARQKRLYGKDEIYTLKILLRTRLTKVLNRERVPKTTDTRTMLGCGYRDLKEHLEKQFTDGMSWENQGDWHIDHIVPLSSANNKEELYQLFHYKNLQPLWAKDNLSKGKKLLKKF